MVLAVLLRVLVAEGAVYRNPLRLSVGCNLSVFYCEIGKDKLQAMKLAKRLPTKYCATAWHYSALPNALTLVLVLTAGSTTVPHTESHT